MPKYKVTFISKLNETTSPPDVITLEALTAEDAIVQAKIQLYNESGGQIQVTKVEPFISESKRTLLNETL